MKKSYSKSIRKLEKKKQEQILEELSQQVARKDKAWQEIDAGINDIDKRMKKMAKKGKMPKMTINELEPEERRSIHGIITSLDELKFLSGEADTDYIIDCWLGIKAKYSKLSNDAKYLALPTIKEKIKPLGKQFKI